MSIEFIRKFIADNASNPQFQSFTTTDVCVNIVIPHTLPKKCAFINLFEGQTDASGKPYLGKASVFVSHAWKYCFSDPVDVMEQYEAEHSGTYYWFDLFINNQNIASNLPQEWWKTTFRTSIKSIGAVLLVLAPWNNPIPITRAWCLWEIMCALSQNGVELTINLPTNQENALLDGVEADPDSISNALTEIRAEKAEAFKPDDKKMIFEAIEETVGFIDVNQQIKKKLKATRDGATATSTKVLNHLLHINKDKYY